MRLGFHYHVPARGDANGIQTPAYQGRFLDSLASACSELVCFLHSPLPTEQAQMDYRLQQRNIRLVDLGPHVSVPRRLLGARHCARAVRCEQAALDVLLLRGPSPLLPTLAAAARPLPVALLLVGDAVAGVDDTGLPLWRRTAIRWLWRWNRWRQDQVAQETLTFVNSRKLFRQMTPYVPELVEVRTTTLTRSDFLVRDDTCAQPPYRLLYTGRMTRAKGLMEMVDALALLVQARYDVRLDLVGWAERNDAVLAELEQQAARLNVQERVVFHGPKAAGPELYRFYRQADLYVLASKSDFEGFPRTIWEAMAHSLPVVATRVGSIPDLIDGAAMLIEPNDPRRLAQALETLLQAPARRQELIRRGRELAGDMTLETQTGKLMERLKTWTAAQS